MWNRSKWGDIGWITLLTLLAIILNVIPVQLDLLRIPVGVLFVVIAPGYALVAAFFRDDALEMPDRVAFSIGLSISLAALGGLFLHGLRLGFEAKWWLLLLAGMTFLGVAGTIVRRRLLESAVNYYVPIVHLRDIGLFAVAGVIVLIAIVWAIIGAENQSIGPHTELSIQPASVSESDHDAITIDVVNHEGTATEYRITVSINQTEIGRWDPVLLASDEEWKQDIELPERRTGFEEVRVLLYRLTDPDTVYRYVTLRRTD